MSETPTKCPYCDSTTIYGHSENSVRFDCWTAMRNDGRTLQQGDVCKLRLELAAARAELALHEDNARQSLEEIEVLRANFTEWSCRARAFEDERDQARAELAALRAEQATPQWLPIEGAPRDGTSILLNDHGDQCVAYWLEGTEWTEEWTGEPAMADPTHWMPLPAPPRDLREGGE